MSDKSPGTEHYVNSMVLRANSASTQEIVEELEKALELGLSDPEQRIDAMFVTGLGYTMLAVRASEDVKESMTQKGLELVRQAALTDRELNHGYFHDMTTRKKLAFLDTVYYEESRKYAEIDDNNESAIEYLQDKIDIFDHLPSPPLFATLSILASLYNTRGEKERAKACWTSIVEAESIPDHPNEARARELATEALHELSEEENSMSKNDLSEYDVLYIFECPSCGRKMESLANIKAMPCSCPSHDYMKLRYKKYRDGTMEEVKEEESKGGCYIATVCYGSYDAPEVQTLRTFRDERLLTSFWGKLLVHWYYRFSPYLANKLQQKPGLNTFIRLCLLDNIIKRLQNNSL